MKNIELLKEADSRFAVEPLIVACQICATTMWCNSDNAFVVDGDAIICRNCLGPHRVPVKTQEPDSPA